MKSQEGYIHIVHRVEKKLFSFITATNRIHLCSKSNYSVELLPFYLHSTLEKKIKNKSFIYVFDKFVLWLEI